MAKLNGQDSSKSVTEFGATSPGQSGKNFNSGTVGGKTTSPSAAGAGFKKAGTRKGGTLGDKFRRLAESRKQTKVTTTSPGVRSGKKDLNTIF